MALRIICMCGYVIQGGDDDEAAFAGEVRGHQDRVAVIIDSARPGELAAVIMLACGAVRQGAWRDPASDQGAHHGRDRRRSAPVPYTVQDYLKTISRRPA